MGGFRHFAVESDKKMAISRMGTVVIFISVALLVVVSAEEEMIEKRGGDKFFATGLGGRLNAKYAAKRLHAIDRASAEWRRKFFGKRLLADDQEENVEKRGGDKFFATGMGGRMNAQYMARRLHQIDGASARQRQKFFGKRLLAGDQEEMMEKRGGDKYFATG